MYEDISNLLNNGEVPNLFPVEEKAKIVEEISNMMPHGSINQKYAFFIKQCKEQLRLILCMSPVGETFRKRIRTFPGLVNCTTIDWFKPWPKEALM
jgi:dynein heavy chain